MLLISNNKLLHLIKYGTFISTHDSFLNFVYEIVSSFIVFYSTMKLVRKDSILSEYPYWTHYKALYPICCIWDCLSHYISTLTSALILMPFAFTNKPCSIFLPIYSFGTLLSLNQVFYPIPDNTRLLQFSHIDSILAF